ncbi:uncharacterized protein LY89DRAFT_189153 [Mollisia scopiformis]|uniref:GAT domain-containing protein n=1 Tax=Mollisia scopiformis TaxID=149040 RepID=A0A194XTV4_MOLSC|nr:uncharacterized protein LY89DRAFT_189153 [Mollisia scopiformis]KUJ23643.1 hypothetical protein LY89DRAFT_189153 [Mollisia scopiformis]
MKAMKGMNVNRMFGSLKRKPNSSSTDGGMVDSGLDTPEANATRNVRLFCESGGPNGSGEEVLYLPTIVESCESSPSAAKEAAYVIRKFLSKDNFSKPYVQYNGIMLIRILADNPGKTFTRNVDTKFVETVKELLRVGRDPSVKQILMETLDTFQREKADDEGLVKLNEMWKKEHERMIKIHGPAGPRVLNAPAFNPNSPEYFSRNHHSRRLPPPHELSTRIEEAKTSASLLAQVVQSTPPSELLSNELVREFADRCQSASRSVQAYMIAENPGPDNDTMETLIETNEQLSKALSQHQRAVLNARKILGLNGESGTTPPATGGYSQGAPNRTDYLPPGGPPPNRNSGYSTSGSGFALPQGPPPGRTGNGFVAPAGPPPTLSMKPVPRKAAKGGPPVPPPGDYAPTGDDEENPFSDPKDNNKPSIPFPKDQPPTSTGQFNDRLGIEPYHPGFRETPSYVGRQESSTGGVTMHAAVPETPDVDDEGRARDLYGVSPGVKAPVYRY